MSVLEARGLSVAINDHVVVADVSLRLEPGRTLALVGASGSGKTLTARALLDLAAPARIVAGGVWLDGRALAGDAAYRAVRGRDVAMVFQDPLAALNPLHTVG